MLILDTVYWASLGVVFGPALGWLLIILLGSLADGLLASLDGPLPWRAGLRTRRIVNFCLMAVWPVLALALWAF